MSQYYNSSRARNLYDPQSKEPFQISRSKIELFINCPKCFYLDRRLGVKQVPGYPFSLNSAVDALLKKEFDYYRKLGKPHPLFKRFKVEAVPFAHEKMDEWRTNFKGVQFLHGPTNLLITGTVDDIWINKRGELIVADYKATAKNEEITALDKDWQVGYKRQAEMYQWLLRMNGFRVSKTAYFVYANGDASKKKFGNVLEFDTRIIPYKGDDAWVEGVIFDIKKCLNSKKIPASGDDCHFCQYREAVEKLT